MTFRCLFAVPFLLAVAACGSKSSSPPAAVVSSHAYRGHENNLDMNQFVNAYKNAVGTRLDDCQTCHKGGTFSYVSSGTTKTTTKNACDYCHLIQYPDSTFIETQPTTFADTLNAYGVDYSAAGRNTAAFATIADKDSDGDGSANKDEIADLKYPGDTSSKPGQQAAPMKTFTMAQLSALAAHQEFMLANANKQQYDFYASYKGVTIADLLTAAGVDPTDPSVTGVTLIAPDGYLKDFPASKLTQVYPQGLYYAGLDTTTLGTTCGFVQYPTPIPSGLTDGGTIPDEQHLLLAYERDGGPMDPSVLDNTTGKINGEGPLRVIVPQSTPGKPDRGSTYSPSGCSDGNDYNNAADHNAGDMVRGVIGIRVNPLPAGVEDFDYLNGGWAYIDLESVIVYGYGITSAN